MTQPEKPGHTRESPRLLPGVAAVLLAGFISVACTSLDPPISGSPPETASERPVIPSHPDRAGDDTGVLQGEVTTDDMSLSLPGYCLGPSREVAGETETTAAPSSSIGEARGVLLSLSDGSLKDYEGRNVRGRILIIEPLVTDLAPALHQARLFGASAVVAAPRETGAEEEGAFAEYWIGVKDPGLPVFLLFPSGAAQLRQLEGREVVLRFPVEAPGGPWRITGRPLVSSAEEGVGDILDRDRKPLLLLPWVSRLAEAWRGRGSEPEGPDFYNTVMARVESWNLGVSAWEDSDSQPSRADMTLLARDLERFWMVLELNLLNGVLTEGVRLMESGREEELPRIFSPYLLSARAIPRFLPEAVTSAQRGGSDASFEKGERWLPDLGDLFLSLSLGLQHNEETRRGMIKELEYWERRSRILLKEAEARFLTMTDDLLSRIDNLKEGLPQGKEADANSLPNS